MINYSHAFELKDLILNQLEANGLYRNRQQGQKREFDVMSPLSDEQLCHTELSDCQYSVVNTVKDGAYSIMLYGMKTGSDNKEYNQLLFFTYAFDVDGFTQANLVFMDLISDSETSLLGW